MKEDNGIGPVAEMASESCLARGVDHGLVSAEIHLLKMREHLVVDLLQLLAAYINEDRISVFQENHRSILLLRRWD